jgi:hypothetical protein
MSQPTRAEIVRSFVPASPFAGDSVVAHGLMVHRYG